MTDKSDDNYYGVLLEEMRDQFRMVMEAVGDIQRQTVMLPEIRQGVRILKDKMATVELAIRDLSKEGRDTHDQVDLLERRIDRLEAA